MSHVSRMSPVSSSKESHVIDTSVSNSTRTARPSYHSAYIRGMSHIYQADMHKDYVSYIIDYISYIHSSVYKSCLINECATLSSLSFLPQRAYTYESCLIYMLIYVRVMYMSHASYTPQHSSTYESCLINIYLLIYIRVISYT